MTRRRAIAMAISLVGGALVTAGVALIYPPAALIVAGGGLLAFGLLVIDVSPPKRGPDR